jgi:hypothetical protein
MTVASTSEPVKAFGRQRAEEQMGFARQAAEKRAQAATAGRGGS